MVQNQNNIPNLSISIKVMLYGHTIASRDFVTENPNSTLLCMELLLRLNYNYNFYPSSITEGMAQWQSPCQGEQKMDPIISNATK